MLIAAMVPRLPPPSLTPLVATLALALVLALGGCASSAGIQPSAHVLGPAQVGLAGVDTNTTFGADWWSAFDDTTLNGLVERALAGNPGLKLVQIRIARAEAAVTGQQANAGPQVNGTLDITRQQFSANSIYPPPLGGSIRTLGTAQLNASWEFDFFGRNRAAIEAAIGAQRAAQAEAQAARVVLASQVVRSYVQLGRLQAQREVAERSLMLHEDTLKLINQRVLAGLDTALEQRQGEGALPETRLQIEQLDEQISLTRNALAALTARPPSALDGLNAPLRAVRATSLPSTLPADLLGRRADIVAARWRIEAASNDVLSAKAAFYPSVNLTAFVGLASIGLDRLVKTTSEQYGAGPALRLPIFDAGRLRANLRIKTADVDAAVESYNNAVVDAVHEAADQIGSLRSIERQQNQQAQAQAAAESSFDLATQRYKAGLATYLTVLNAETNVLAQRRTAVDLKARALDGQVALIRALGGGYEPDNTGDVKPARPTLKN